MLKIAIILVVVVSTCFAKNTVLISRGGLGFIFPDTNNFSVNPSSLANLKTLALEFKYQTLTPQQTFSSSVAIGNNKLGFGIYGKRSGTNLKESSSSTDYAGAGLGFKFLKGKVMLGISYDRLIDTGSTNSGVAGATISLISTKKTGPALSVGYKRTINQQGGEIQSLKAAIGYLISGVASIELIGNLADINQKSNYEGILSFSIEQKFWYSSFSYQYLKVDASQFIHGRIGVILKNIDFSLFGKHRVTATGATEYGATFRLSF